jgi:predicted DCC family thiol-disulfide oxidoreductase YuxK
VERAGAVTGVGAAERAGGWVFYDGVCSMCTALAARWGATLREHGVDLAPLQARGVRERLGVTPEELRSQMWVLTANGRVFGGGDAAVYLARAIRSVWWAQVLIVTAALPGGMPVIRWVYRWVANHREYFGGTCSLGDPGVWPPEPSDPPTRSSQPAP